MVLFAAAWQAVVVAAGVGGTAEPGAAVEPEADLTISGPWGDNMVLQSNHNYGQRAFMSGTAEPGSRIVIVAPMREDKGSDIETTADEQCQQSTDSCIQVKGLLPSTPHICF